MICLNNTVYNDPNTFSKYISLDDINIRLTVIQTARLKKCGLSKAPGRLWACLVDPQAGSFNKHLILNQYKSVIEVTGAE